MFKCYIFDLDGTIIDSEYYHYQAYKNQCPDLTYIEYQRIFHSEDLKKTYIKDNNIDTVKKEEDFKRLYEVNKKYIPGAIEYINSLILDNKDIVIVTNSSKERCDFIKKMHPELVNIQHWITKSDVKHKKPNPEGYIKAMNMFSYNIDEYIIFEDSYTGFETIQNLNVAKGWVMNNEYYYKKQINSVCFEHYNNVVINYPDDEIYNTTNDKLSSYSEQLTSNFENMKKNIYYLAAFILSKNVNNIYMCGVGKSNYILKKTASSWRSIGINVHVIECENLFHGEFSLFQDNDLLILSSNSGNTIELVNLVTYLNSKFNVMKVIVSNKQNNNLSDKCDLSLVIGEKKFVEADCIHMVPSVSSMMFLIFFDMVGIYLSEKAGLTMKDFKKYHPGGELGKIDNIGDNSVIDYIVISACGKGTRLYPMTKNIPKFLVNCENKNFLTMMFEYWSTYSSQFIIILDDIYNDIVNYYIEQYNKAASKKITVEIVNIKCPDGYENSFTLSHGVPNKCYNKKVLVTWCDIMPREDILLKDMSENIIFTYKTYSRYQACQQTQNIYKDENGNIVGIYYFCKFKQLQTNDYTKDLCDVFIDNYKTFTTSEINSLIDIGDTEKYLDEVQINTPLFKTRFFNEIKQTNRNTVVKRCVDTNFGKGIFKNETHHYKVISILNKNSYRLFPKAINFSNNSFEIEMINGKNVYNAEITTELVQQFIDKLLLLHSLSTYKPEKSVFERDLNIEFFTKVNTRLQNILPILNHFNQIISNVNSVDIDLRLENIQTIISNCYDYIKTGLSEKNMETYHTIHGDCQFSNSMISDNDIIFIDPRGYFGDTKVYGLKEYDYSKLLYALSGYDNFNNDITYCFEYVSSNSIVLNMSTLENLDMYRPIFEKNDIDFDICMRMIIIHWIALSDYNKNNIIKSITSIFIGMYLYSKYVV